MAQTIYGCVNWGEGGRIEFESVDCISENIRGCINWTGAHAGQVEVTITTADEAVCNDTFYGCIDWATGKFQISLPECCFCPCSYSNDIPECYQVNKTPEKVIVRFTGVLKCSDDSSLDLNDVDICVSYYGSYTYGSFIGDAYIRTYGNYTIIYMPYCCKYGSPPYVTILIVLLVNPANSCFSSGVSLPPCKISISSVYAKAHCSDPWSFYSYGGSAVISNNCDECIGEIWVTAHSYIVDDEVKILASDSTCYICTQNHTSDADKKPGSGIDWEDYWDVV